MSNGLHSVILGSLIFVEGLAVFIGVGLLFRTNYIRSTKLSRPGVENIVKLLLITALAVVTNIIITDNNLSREKEKEELTEMRETEK